MSGEYKSKKCNSSTSLACSLPTFQCKMTRVSAGSQHNRRALGAKQEQYIRRLADLKLTMRSKEGDPSESKRGKY